MSTRHSKYLDELKRQTSSKASSAEASRTSYLQSTPGSSYLCSSGTLPTKASAAKADFNASLLRSISGASDTGSPLSATGHRPASKVQRTISGHSSSGQSLTGGKDVLAPPVRRTTRSQSTLRGAPFADDRPVSTSRPRPIAAATNAYTASSSGRSSNAAPLQSFYSLPPTRTLTGSTAAGSQPQRRSQPIDITPTLQSRAAQSSRMYAPPSTSRLDKLYAAYGEPAGKPSNSRSMSVGRRSSSDIAAALNRSLDMGIGSLGARPQPVRTVRTVSVDRRSSDIDMAAGSSYSGVSQVLEAERVQARRASQQSSTQAVDTGNSRRAYPDPSCGSSMSGRSSLIERSSSRSSSFEGAGAQAARDERASQGLPSRSDSEAESTSGRQALSRQSSSMGSSYQTTYHSAYSIPSSSFRSLSVKHDAHGDRVIPASQHDLIQAVPSGSGRISLAALQEQQQPFAVSCPSHVSGKALMTAALSQLGLTSMRSGKGFVGLTNLGNTCFANSIMQCLVAVPELASFFLLAASEGGLYRPTGLVSGAFGSLVQQLWQSHGGAIDPYGFMRACGSHEKQWKDGRQHDAQEYLRSILEAMQTELNRVKGKAPYKELKGEGTVSQQADEAWEYAHSRSNSIIQDIFAGQLQSTLECPACHALSHTFDEFMDLSLPLPQKGSRSLRGGSTCTIQDCLDAFTETETLEEEEGYNCQSCKRKGVCATKKLTLYRCPPVLVLHLKRFNASGGALGIFSRFSAMSKDTTPVDVVADKLDLSPYCSMAARKQTRKPVYSLTAVTNHSGSMSGGHYTAQCRSALDDNWYDCNDSSVRPDRFVAGPSSSAYVLFYRLQD